MTTRERLPPYARVALLVFAAVNLAVVVADRPPAWLRLSSVALALGLVGLGAVHVVRSPSVLRAAWLLWILAGAVLLIALLSLGVHLLS